MPTDNKKRGTIEEKLKKYKERIFDHPHQNASLSPTVQVLRKSVFCEDEKKLPLKKDSGLMKRISIIEMKSGQHTQRNRRTGLFSLESASTASELSRQSAKKCEELSPKSRVQSFLKPEYQLRLELGKDSLISKNTKKLIDDVRNSFNTAIPKSYLGSASTRHGQGMKKKQEIVPKSSLLRGNKKLQVLTSANSRYSLKLMF